jgi:hypothetical protein
LWEADEAAQEMTRIADSIKKRVEKSFADQLKATTRARRVECVILDRA